MCVLCLCRCPRRKKEGARSPGAELQAVMSCPALVLGPGSSQEQQAILTTKPISSPIKINLGGKNKYWLMVMKSLYSCPKLFPYSKYLILTLYPCNSYPYNNISLVALDHAFS